MGTKSQLPKEVRDQIIQLRGEGLSLAKIAKQLTDAAIPTALGGNWHGSTIKRVLNSPQTKAYVASA
jgi:hypothetical protein